MSNVSENDLNHMNKEFGDKEKLNDILGVAGKLAPMAENTSSVRREMYNAHINQSIILDKPEFPKVFTGYEKEAGRYLDSKMVAECNYRIVAKISKFKNIPNVHYILVVQNQLNNEYDIIEIKKYENLAESYGYIRENTIVDSLQESSIIPEGTVIYRASSYDENGLWRYGISAKTAYLSIAGTLEDAVIVSESFANKTQFHKVEKIDLDINNNDILMNIYGDKKNYKCIPSVGEHAHKKGIVISVRQFNNRTRASTTNTAALSSIRTSESDTNYKGTGILVDYDIKVNDVAALEKEGNGHRKQLLYMYQQQYNFNNEIVQVLKPIVDNNRLIKSNKLQLQYFESLNYISPNVKYSNNNGKFELLHLSLFLVNKTHIGRGHKVTNRYGGKSIICGIWKDDMMPVDTFGNRAEIIYSPSSIVKRANISQSYEHELNFIASFIQKNIINEPKLNKKFKILYDFLIDINKEYANDIASYYNSLIDDNKIKFMNTVELDGIYMKIPPLGSGMNFDKIKMLYSKYNVHPGKIMIKIKQKINPNIKKNLYMFEEEFEKRKDFINKYAVYTDETNTKLQMKHEGTSFYDERYTDNSLNINTEVYENNKDEIAKIYKFKGDGYGIDDINKHKKMIQEFKQKTVKNEYLERILNHNGLIQKNNNEHIGFIDGYGCVGRFDTGEENSIYYAYVTDHPVIIAEEHFIVLKQLPEDKHSSRSIGTINTLGIPTKVSSTYAEPHSQSAVHLGEMEIQLLYRLVPEDKLHVIAKYLETHSTNPDLSRRLYDMLLMNNPLEYHTLDLNPNEFLNSNPAKALKMYLLSIGIGMIHSGEDDPYAWFDDINCKDVDEYLNILSKKNK